MDFGSSRAGIRELFRAGAEQGYGCRADGETRTAHETQGLRRYDKQSISGDEADGPREMLRRRSARV